MADKKNGGPGNIFQEYSELTLNDYKNQRLKKAKLKNTKGGLVITQFTIGSRKKQGIFIPIKMYKAAELMFAVWNDMKKSPLRVTAAKIAVVKVTTKEKDGTFEVILSPQPKGQLKDPSKIHASIDDLFTGLDMKLSVAGHTSDTSNEDKEKEDKEKEETGNETSNTSETSTDETTTGNETSDTQETTVDPAKKAKRVKQLTEMKAGVEKMDGMKDKLSKEQLEANIQKYETALATLIKDAEADGIIDQDEKKEIDELTDELDKLKKFTNELQSGKKLTPERRQKINENMDKINARLEAITKKLGL